MIEVYTKLPGESTVLRVVNDATGDAAIGHYAFAYERRGTTLAGTVRDFDRARGAEALLAIVLAEVERLLHAPPAPPIPPAPAAPVPGPTRVAGGAGDPTRVAGDPTPRTADGRPKRFRGNRSNSPKLRKDLP